MSRSATAVVILGAANDAQGNLSSVGVERCRQGAFEYRQRPGSKIIPTGGWGSHFNTTDKPHGDYTRRCLQQLGVPTGDILETVESSNTIEDAALCCPVVERHGIVRLVVVTSDFHLERARFIFQQQLPHIELQFAPAKTHLPPAALNRLKAHERHALARLRSEL